MAEIYRRASHITGPQGASVVPGYPITCYKESFFFPTTILKLLEEHKPSTEAKKGGYFPQGPGQCLKEPERLVVSLCACGPRQDSRSYYSHLKIFLSRITYKPRYDFHLGKLLTLY